MYVGQGEQSSFDACSCSYVILSESEWFARYVSEWIWYETFPYDETKWGGSDLIVKERTRNPLFQSAQFSIVETNFVHGGMEYPNLVMISNEIESQDDYLNVIIHETAHQWWYGIVGNYEFKHPWLDEALTEFSTVLFYDNNEGYNLSHKQIIDTASENYSLFISVYEDVLGSIDTSMRSVDEYQTEPEYTYCIYVKGVLMYDSLYQLIGKKDFLNSLKIYFNKSKFKNATPTELISAFEQSSKTKLDNFFSAWLNGKVQIR